MAKGVGNARNVRAIAGFSIAIVSFAICSCIVGWFLWCAHNAHTTPSPGLPYSQDSDGFPTVDWNHWKQVNPDIVGWVSVPGTELSCAIVQARPDDPTYYLEHDIHGNPNYHGCPYLDADCSEAGLDSKNAVIFGHNIRNGSSMFATFAKYSTIGFAQDHPVVLLQTPTWKRAMNVSGAAIVKGSQRTKRTDFETQVDFGNWFSDRLKECCVVLDDNVPQSCVTFVTCSYNRYSNERTLVYAAS